MCTACEAKKLPRCVYDANDHKVELHEHAGNSIGALQRQNAQLRARIAELESSRGVGAQSLGSTATTPSSTPDDEPIDRNKFQSIQLKRNKVKYIGLSTWESLMTTESGILPSYIVFFRKSIKSDRAHWKVVNRPDTSTFNSLIDVNSADLLKNLELVLPTYTQCAYYFDNFFEGIWFNFLPILDKDEMMDKFREIFSSKGSNDRVQLTLGDSQIEYSYLALIIILIKYELVAELNDTANLSTRAYADDDDLLLKFVRKLLACSDHMEKSSIPAVQTLFLMRLLRLFDSRDGDGGDGSKGVLQFTTAFQMGILLALHQDIDYLYKEQTASHRLALKNLWVRLLFFDSLQSFDRGIPLLISDADLRTEFLDLDDIFVKTTLQLRKACNYLMSPVVTIRSLEKRIADLKSFLRDEFEPIFDMIQLYRDLKGAPESLDVSSKIFLAQTVICFLQNGHQFLFYVIKPIDEKRSIAYYTSTIKYTLLLMTSGSEIQQAAESEQGSSSPYDRAAATRMRCFVAGMTRHGYVRCFLVYFTSVMICLGGYFPGQVADVREEISIKMSDLQDLSDGADVLEPFLEGNKAATGLAVMNSVITSTLSSVLWLDRDFTKTSTETLARCVNDYSLFILLLSANHLDKVIKRETSLAAKLRLSDVKVDVVRDIAVERSTVQPYTRLARSDNPLAILDNPIWQIDYTQLNDDFDKYVTDWVEKSANASPFGPPRDP